MLSRFLFLVCLISASHLSLSQESGAAMPRAPVSKMGVVYVVGDVHRPIDVVMEDTDPVTVLKALATAEGANPTANLRNAKILRKGETGRVEVPVDIKKIMQAKAPDVTLQADDILFVPQSGSKSARKLPKEDDVPRFYDVPPTSPLESSTPIYIR
jgi:hypothetical protein